jgi:transketolase
MKMKHLTDAQVESLEAKAYEIRKLCLEFITSSGWGHIGGSFSAAELLACLYDVVLTIDPQRPDAPERDRFILSKAHTSPALYATLAIQGFFPREKVFSYCRIGGLDGHTQRGQCPGIEFSGGSLGTGLSYAAGVALSLRLRENYHSRVFCLVGDGECNEGQIWEAGMFAAHYSLDNLIVIVDYNKVMAKGKVNKLMALEPLRDKLTSFGWSVLEVDGHDVREICSAFHRAKYVEANGRPVAILAHTVKGRGIPECEFNYQWHTHAPGVKQAQVFLAALNRECGRAGTFDRPLVEPKDGGLEAVIREALV